MDGLMLLKPRAFASKPEREAYSSGCQSSSSKFKFEVMKSEIPGRIYVPKHKTNVAVKM